MFHPLFFQFQGLSSHSIYDTVLQANDWCLAVSHSTAVIYEDSGGAVGRVLKEATWIFELAGVGIFAGATYTTTQVGAWEIFSKIMGFNVDFDVDFQSSLK